MKITAVLPYSGNSDWQELVDVYDITVEDVHLYSVQVGNVLLLVSNSKRVAMLDMNALMSHGAIETARDVRLVKGQKNDRLWMNFMQGYAPHDPKVPHTYEKFIHRLQGSGINVVRQGTQTHLMALTDPDVKTLAGDRRVTSGDTVRFDHELRPIPGGLFDPQLTGGHGGKLWSAVDLPEPYPSPVMEEPIRRLLGLTKQKFLATLSGEHTLPGIGTGPKAIGKALDGINLDAELRSAKADYEHGRAFKRDEAVRRWGYLHDAKRLNLHPRDWMLSQVPVLPPAFRPVSILGNSGVPLVSDPNYLYKELIDTVKTMTP